MAIFTADGLAITSNGLATEGTAMPPPGVPVLTAYNATPTSNVLEWTYSQFTEYATVYRSIDGESFVQIGAAIYDTNTYTDTDVVAGHIYEYKVVLTNDTDSVTSNIVSVEVETVSDRIDRTVIPFRVNPYLGEVPSPIHLWRLCGGKGIEYRKLRQNFELIEASLQGLKDNNFRRFAEIVSTKVAAIVYQDEITSNPNFDSTVSTDWPDRNRIPRLDSDGALTLGMNSTAKAYDMRIVNVAGTEALACKDSIGAFTFRISGSVAAYLSATAGWGTGIPAETAATKGWSVIFDDTRSLWLFYKDNDVIGIVDGNVTTGAFVTVTPTTTYEAEEAYINLNSANNRIEFFCKTANDAAIKLCGYIDATGTH